MLTVTKGYWAELSPSYRHIVIVYEHKSLRSPGKLSVKEQLNIRHVMTKNEHFKSKSKLYIQMINLQSHEEKGHTFIVFDKTYI